MDGCLILFLGITVLLLMLLLKLPLWLVFVSAALFTALLAGGLGFIPEAVYMASIDRATIDLVVIMYLIAIFVSLYKSTGFIDRLGRELALFLRKPFIVASFVPALLGLLPVPGGALMSIPVVDSVGDYMGLDKDRKLFINVWYRHVIFIVYPISSVLVLTASLTGTTVFDLVIRQAPIALSMLFIGYVIGFPRKYGKTSSELFREEADKKLLLKVFSPIIVSIVIALSTSKFLDYKLSYIPVNRLSLLLGISIGIALLMILSKTGLRDLGKAFTSKTSIEMALVGYGAMLLKLVFSSIDLSCITEYMPIGLSPAVFVMSIPLFFSLVSGIPTAGVALSIPILRELTTITSATASLIYISSFIGYLGSPLHLCYIYTAQYLGISITRGYKYLIPASIATLFIAYLVYILT